MTASKTSLGYATSTSKLRSQELGGKTHESELAHCSVSEERKSESGSCPPADLRSKGRNADTTAAARARKLTKLPSTSAECGQVENINLADDAGVSVYVPKLKVHACEAE